MGVDLLFGVVAGADEGAGFYVADAFEFAAGFPVFEFVGVDPALDGEVVERRLEVLAEGEDVAADGDEVVEDGVDLVFGFTQAEHHAGLADEALLFGDLKELEGAMVFGLGADGAVESRDGFDVVVEDVGFLVEDELKGIPVAAEIGDEDFDAGAGGLEANLTDGFGPDACAAVGEFIAVDAGDDSVLEVHAADCVADAAGLVEVEGWGAAGGDVAEAAASGADIAEDHERGGTGGPAFTHVGAFGGLADGVEAVFVDEVQEVEILLAGGHFHAEPGGLPAGGGGFVGQNVEG